MTSQEIVRTSFVVGGIYLIVTACAVSGASSATSIVFLLGMGRDLDGDLMAAIGMHTVSWVFATAIFGLLPGCYFISSRERWARRLAGDSSESQELTPNLLLGVAGMVLGLSFGIGGFTRLVGGVATLIAGVGADAVEQIEWATGVTGFVQLGAGVWVFRWGRAKLAQSVAQLLD